jgi:hypothetical protein
MNGERPPHPAAFSLWRAGWISLRRPDASSDQLLFFDAV